MIAYFIIIAPEAEETEIYFLQAGVNQLQQKAISFQYTFCFGNDCSVAIDFAEIGK